MRMQRFLILGVQLLSVVALGEEPVKASTVKSIALCWSGYKATVIVMGNSDRMTIGEVTDDIFYKSQYAMLLAAQQSGAVVNYKKSEAGGTASKSTVCGADTYYFEWIRIGEPSTIGMWGN